MRGSEISLYTQLVPQGHISCFSLHVSFIQLYWCFPYFTVQIFFHPWAPRTDTHTLVNKFLGPAAGWSTNPAEQTLKWANTWVGAASWWSRPTAAVLMLWWMYWSLHSFFPTVQHTALLTVLHHFYPRRLKRRRQVLQQKHFIEGNEIQTGDVQGHNTTNIITLGNTSFAYSCWYLSFCKTLPPRALATSFVNWKLKFKNNKNISM